MLMKNFFENLMGACLILMPITIALGVSAADVTAGLVSILFLLLSFMNRDFSWGRALWVKFACVLWAYVSIRILIDVPTLKLNSSLFLWPRFFLLALAYQYYFIKHSKNQSFLLMSLGGAVSFLVGDLYLQLFSGHDVFGRPDLWNQLTGPYKMPRAGMTLVLLVFPLLGFLWQKARENKVYLGVYGIISLLLGGIIFCTGERMAFLLFLFGYFVFCLYYLPIKPIIKTSFCLGGIILILGTILFFGQNQPYLDKAKKSPYLSRHVVKTIQNVSEFENHVYGMNVISSWRFFLKSPLIGIGKRNFYQMCAEQHPENPGQYCANHPHNTYLEFLAEFGLIGFLLFLGMLITGGKKLVAGWHTLKDNPLYIGLLVALFLKLWPIVVSTSFFHAWGAIPFWMVFGWALAMNKTQSSL